LNEEAAPGESLDDIKREEARKHAKDREWMRELMRKNRQLVEDNKVKSLTIRGLNDEIARLRAQNLVLREDVMKLRLEMRKRPTQDRVRKVSDSLRHKLDTLQEVLVELELVQEPLIEEPQTPAREWKREQRARVSVDDPTKLPTIREDKAYPRHSDSPGTPPVTSLAAEELIAELERDPEPESHIPEAGSVNLETRRKRRDSSQKLDIKRIPIFQSPPRDGEQQDPIKSRKPAPAPKDLEELDIPKSRKLSNPIRAGSKRKISPLDEEKEPSKASDSPPPQQSAVSTTPTKAPPSITASPSLRQPLLTKSVNTSPIPPASALPVSSDKPAKLQLKDTPPPTTTNSVMDGAPTLVPTRVRRARPTVNYAEPNLVSKMRRPSKELADAVVPDSHRRTSGCETPDSVPGSVTKSAVLGQKRSCSASEGAAEAISLPVSPLDDRAAALSKESVVRDIGAVMGKEGVAPRTERTGIKRPTRIVSQIQGGDGSKGTGAVVSVTDRAARAHRRKSALI
jgi:hypothetical protein